MFGNLNIVSSQEAMTVPSHGLDYWENAICVRVSDVAAK